MAQVKFYRGLSTTYAGSSTHKDCIFFATDTNQLMLNEVAYGTSASDAAILNSAITSVTWVSPDTLQFKIKDGKEYLNVTFPLATTTTQGLMAASQVIKLNSIEEGAEVNVIEDVVIDGISGTITDKVLAINPGFAKAADVYTKDAADSMVNDKIATALTSVYEYKGSVASYEDLPANPEKGDVYNVVASHELYPAGTNWAWDGTAWDALGGLVDLSEVEGKIEDNADAIAANTKAITDEADRAKSVEAGLRTDLGTAGDAADVSGSAFARIANLAETVASLTGDGNVESVSSQITTAISNLKGDATTSADTLGELEDLIEAEATTARKNESANATAIADEKTRAEDVEAELSGKIATNVSDIEALEGRMDAVEGSASTNAAAIATLNGTGEGSVAKQVSDAVAAEAKLRSDSDSALDTRIKALESAVGEDGSVADAIASSIAALDANVDSTGGSKVAVNVVEVDGKITSVTVAESDIASASELASYKSTNDAAVAAKVATADFESFQTANTAAIATAKSEAITKAGENADTKISDAISTLTSSKTGDGTFVDVTVKQVAGKITEVSVVESDIASAALLGTAADAATTNTAFGKAAAAQAKADSASEAAAANANAISALQNNTVNGYKISSNPVLGGEDIVLTNYSVDTNGVVKATDSVNSAIAALEQSMIWHEA